MHNFSMDTFWASVIQEFSFITVYIGKYLKHLILFMFLFA